MIVAIFPTVPSSPVCPTRWEAASLIFLLVNWTTPLKPNGIITAYYVQLFFFNNDTMIESASVDSDVLSLRTRLSDLLLSELLKCRHLCSYT